MRSSYGSRSLRSAAEPQLTATDGPGSQSYFDTSRKDCGGTARNGTSKVLYTVADGVLSDVYYPSTDNTNVSTLQYIVTDGSTFDNLQTRDTTYTVQSTDASGMVCQVTSTANNGDYQLVTTYITDPNDNAVVMHTQLIPLVGQASDYHVYVRFDGTINGNGGGGSSNGGGDTATVDPTTGALVSYDTHTTTSYSAANSYRVPVYAALLADQPFLAQESGFVGAGSDGLTQLDASDKLTTLYTDAANGNVVQTAEINSSNSQWTLALNFDQTMPAAIAGAQASATTPFSQTQTAYSSGWQQYDAALNAPPTSFSGLTSTQDQQLDAQYYLAANLVKAAEDKDFPGAIVSSLGGPWGQDTSAAGTSGGNPSFSVNYRVIFERDLYETFTGLLADGDLTTARNTVYFLFSKVEPANGEFPRDALVNGAVANDNYAFEPDENAYPLIMAYQAGLATDNSIYPGVVRAANWLVSHGPTYGDERWEEQAGYSPSTIAAEIAGLVAAGAIADAHGDSALAQVYRATSDDWQRNIKPWTLTTTGAGEGENGNLPYFIRLSKSSTPVITSSSWSAGVETLNFAAQTAAAPAGVLGTVASACPSGLNGIYAVTAATTTSLSYALPSAPGSCATSLNVTNATYSTSTGRATLTFASTTAPSVGSTVVVSGVTPAGFNGTFTVAASSGTTVQYVLATDPYTFTDGANSYKVTAAAWATGTATLTFSGAPQPSVGDSITVSGINPSGYNGTFTVTASTATTVKYALVTSPGSFVAGGTVAVSATGSVSLPGNPNAPTTYSLGNGSTQTAADQRSVIDAGFLEFARFGELPANDPDILDTLPVVDATLEATTPSGPGWHRYGVVGVPGATDGYGDCYPAPTTTCTPEGRPWVNGDIGSGGTWPLLTGERAEEDLQLGDATDASQLLWTMYQDSGGIGLVPEQDWIYPDFPASPYGTSPATASIGFVDGKPDGSADNITWAEAQEARLIIDLGQNQIVEQPDIVRARYVSSGPPSVLPLAITAPNASTTAATTVTGTTSPGATVVVGVTDTSTSTDDTTQVQTTAGSDGSFSLAVPTPKGTDVITATSSTGPSATGYALGQIISTAALTAPVLTYTGSTTMADGTAGTLSAVLTDPSSGTGIIGPKVTLTLAPSYPQSCTTTATGGGSSSQTNGSGTASCTLNPVMVPDGVRGAQASFSGDSGYAAATANSYVIVAPQSADTLTYTGPISMSDGSGVTFSANLEDANTDVGIDGDTLTFTLAPAQSAPQTCIGTTSGPNGTATCSISNVSQPPGVRSVQVGFSGDANGYAANAVNTTVTVNPGPGDMLAYTGPTMITNGTNVTVSANLEDANTSAGIDGDTLTFILAPAQNAQTCTATTAGASGTASCTIANVNENPGTDDMRVVFGGDATYPSNQLDTPVTVNPAPADTLTYTGPSIIHAGVGIAVSATLTDAVTSAPIVGKSLTLQLAPALGGASCTATTDGTGTASCLLAESGIPTGSYNILVSFGGDATYPANTVLAPVTLAP